MTPSMLPNLSPLLAAIAALAGLAAPAHAKGPDCDVELHGADFTRPIYEAGHWVSARLDVTMTDWRDGTPLARGTERARSCARAWELWTSRSASRASQAGRGSAVDSGRQSIEIWFVADGDDLVIAGWIHPMQAPGLYVFRPWVDQSVEFQVGPNPDADLAPPEPVGVSITYDDGRGPQLTLQIQFEDASWTEPDGPVASSVRQAYDRWIRGTITLEPLGRGAPLESQLSCTASGLCRTYAPVGTRGRYVIGQLMIRDRLGNMGDRADHPLFDGIVIDLDDAGRPGLARGTLSPRPAAGGGPAGGGAPPPESDHPPYADDAPEGPRAPAVDPVEEPAPIAARPSADGCSAAPGPGAGGWMALALLAGWARRRRIG